ncbi:MAG: hypothetical protein ACHQ17_04165 [Polyangia bacterium]
MAPKKLTDSGGELEVAIAGDGVTPESVPVRETIAVIESTIALLEAVAREHNSPMPELSLFEIRNHSAGYALISPKMKGRQTLRRTVDICRRRGEGAGPEVRQRLRRLHAAAKTGHVRFRSKLDHKEVVVDLAAPIDDDPASYVEVGDVVYGRVTGIQALRDAYRVTIRYNDGGTGAFDASAELALQAAPLFDKNVQAHVTFLRGGLDQEGTIEQIAPFEEREFLDTVRSVRRLLEEKGLTLGGSELLDELRKGE